MTARMVFVACVLACLSSGCGRSVGYIIKPVAMDEKLVETVVSQDPGLFVNDKVAIIDVDGLLMNVRSEGLFGPRDNPVSLFAEKLEKAEKDRDIRAVVLRINSPGGGVTATDLMYRRLAQFKSKRKVPVVAAIEDVGASGAYYLACGADAIIAAPTAVTGSIGVIVQTFSLAGTMAKLGIDAKAITSGPLKDMASPFKPLDPADQKVLQAMVEEFHARFVSVVASGRPALERETVKNLADGRIYTGVQAAANGLADATGTVTDAVELAKKRAGLKAVKTVMYDRPWGYKANVHSGPATTDVHLSSLNISVPDLMSWFQPQFLYLWTGDGGQAGGGGQ